MPKEAQDLSAKAAALKSYRARFTLEAKEQTGEPVQMKGTLLFEQPNRRRLELQAGGSKDLSQLLVSDGKIEWQYDEADHLVQKVTSPPEAPGPHRAFAEVQKDSLRFVERVGVSPDVRLRFEGAPLPAVVEGSPVPIEKLRIDVGEQDGLVRELMLLDSKGEAVLTQHYQEVEVNVPIPEGSFAFTPPPGTRVVEPEAPSPKPEEQ